VRCRLGAAFPDARAHVSARLEEVSEALQALVKRADSSSQQLERAAELQAFFGTAQALM
jgi:phage-related minor tail protein